MTLKVACVFLLLIAVQPPASAQSGTSVVPFEFDRETPEYLLIWNAVDEDYDVYEYGTAGIVTEDDTSTSGDDRSQDLDGNTYDEDNYDYTNRTDHVRVEDSAWADGWLDARVEHPYASSGPLPDASEAYMALAIQDLGKRGIIYNMPGMPCKAGFTTNLEAFDYIILEPNYYWAFVAHAPDVPSVSSGWWGSFVECQV